MTILTYPPDRRRIALMNDAYLPTVLCNILHCTNRWTSCSYYSKCTNTSGLRLPTHGYHYRAPTCQRPFIQYYTIVYYIVTTLLLILILLPNLVRTGTNQPTPIPPTKCVLFSHNRNHSPRTGYRPCPQGSNGQELSLSCRVASRKKDINACVIQH